MGWRRRAFNEKFTALVGLPPIRYLTQWRLQMAQEKLRSGELSIGQIAHAIGDESEAAFNRAFKRAFGEPPRALEGATRQDRSLMFSNALHRYIDNENKVGDGQTIKVVPSDQ